MALINISIPIPEKKISYKKDSKGNVKYVYHVLGHRRNKNGTPTCDEVIVGKIDPDRQGRMIPNENFRKYYPMPSDVIDLASSRFVWDAGHVVALKMRAKAIGLLKSLKTIFPDKYEDIFYTALYMACEGNVMMNIDNFLQNTLTPKNISLSSQKTSELFSSITKQDQMKFFSMWKNYAMKNNETVAYDVTSLSTYADLPLAENGYNRDKEYLPQLNVGLLYATDSNLPISFFLYSGSVVDKVFLTTMMEYSKSLGIDDIFYVLDRGFITKENLEYIKKEQIEFLVAVPKSQKNYNDTMREASVTLRSSRNHISGTNCYGVRKDIVINGEKFSLYIYLNTKSASEEESTLYSHIDRLEDELKELKKPMSMSRYSKYYKIKTKKEVQLESFERDHEKITDILSMLGVFAFLSNHSTMTPQEALHIYSRRDFIEKAFDNLKNELDNDRMLTHNEKTTDGKSFVSFLSLIMWSDLQRTINNNDKKVEKTIQRVLEALKMIRRIDNENLSMLLQPLTKKQKDILEALEIDQKIFVDKILNTKV